MNTKNNYAYKDIITIKCDAGYTKYTIGGQEHIQCQADGTWSTPPICNSRWFYNLSVTINTATKLFLLYNLNAFIGFTMNQ